MDLAGRIAKGRSVEGAWVVPLLTAVPAAPPSLADVRVEIRAVGNTLVGVSSAAEIGPRPPAFWRTLGEEIHAFIGRGPCAAELAIIGRVIRGLAPCAARDRIERRVLDILDGAAIGHSPSAVSPHRKSEGSLVQL